MNFFDALRDSPQRQGFLGGDGNCRRYHCRRQRKWPAALVPNDQAIHPLFFPCLPPVVDRLVADAQILGNRIRMLACSKLQQRGGTQARIPPFVINRQLDQRFLLARIQQQFNFHLKLSDVNTSHLKARFKPVLL